MRRAYAEISATALRHNFDVVRKLAGGADICAVVKANAYEHGALQTARTLCDAAMFAVATPHEAMELRTGGITRPILVMGYTPPEFVCEMADNNIAVTLFDREQAETVSRALSGKTIGVHIKIDSGMSRLGFSCDDKGLSDVLHCLALPGLRPDAAFTHFAGADDFTLTQRTSFLIFIDLLKTKGHEFPVLHCANSAAVIEYPETHLDMVRPGLALYGYSPIFGDKTPLLPALSFYACVAQVKSLRAGETVSYDRIFTALTDMNIAIISAGYADGVPRALSNNGTMLLHGKKAPIIGRVCMDMLMLDISGIPNVKTGDAAMLFGRETYGVKHDAWMQARCAATIPYELLCRITNRVERIYVD